MVDGVSNVGYGAYNNYSAFKDDFLAQNYFNNYYSVPSSQNDSVSFSGSSGAKIPEASKSEKESSGHPILWSVVIAAGAFLTGKYFNKIKGFFTKGAAKEVFEQAGKNVTQNTKVAESLTNIDTKHVNGNTRKVVTEALDDVVTDAQQAAYDAEIAYRPMTANQKKVYNRINKQNAKERAVKNSIQNNSIGGEKLETVAAELANAEKAAKKIKNGTYLNPANNNKYEIKDGKVVKIMLANGNKEVTDPLKIAKHLDKHNIQIETFASSANKNTTSVYNQVASANNQKLNIAA